MLAEFVSNSFIYLPFVYFYLNSDPVVRDDMNNYISQYYSEASSGKWL